MKINRLSTAHAGNQPIRVLQHNITTQFESTNPTFLELTKTVIQQKGLNPGINYYINNLAIIEKVDGHSQTPYVDENCKIAIHETFLSYVWCISYSMLVLYEEAIAKVSQNIISKSIIHTIDNAKIEKAHEVFDYARSLIVVFSDWEKQNLPNPEVYALDDEFYIERANGLFVYAMNFILCHEFAHVEKGHIEYLKQGKSSATETLVHEKEADERAIELVLLGSDARTKLSTEMGVLIGLCCLLFFSSKSVTTTHPATDERIHNLLETINPPDPADAHWGIAALAYKLWDNQFSKNFTWPKEVRDLKELYELIRKEIQIEKGVS